MFVFSTRLTAACCEATRPGATSLVLMLSLVSEDDRAVSISSNYNGFRLMIAFRILTVSLCLFEYGERLREQGQQRQA